MTQLNTPYPATAYLTGFLRSRGWNAVQADPAIELILLLFSRGGLQDIFSEMKESEIEWPLGHFEKYLNVIEPTLRFLQGKDPSLALRIVGREFLPEGPRFSALDEGDDPDPLSWAFGSLGVQDRAKYLASLFVDDLADVIRYGIDPRFELSRYGEKLAASAPSFDPLAEALKAPPTLVDRYLNELTIELFNLHQPDVVGMTVPFPGNVYGAFRMAQKFKQLSPTLPLLLGGGYVNTELRQLNEPRVFDYFDYITLDDGERPLLRLLEVLSGQGPRENLFRTFVREEGRVVLKTNTKTHDIPHKDIGTPTYDGLPLDRYLSLFEMLNPMHRIWSDGRWNKLTLAHGCYWKKCSFCDISLDYIGRYDPASADLLVDRIEALIQETGQRGFHFVDEAAPPAVLRGLAERLIARGVAITWWGNVRFDKVFTSEFTSLLARSGCVAVSGGLEATSDRLLKLMQKGVTVAQGARVTRAFADAGIMVHAYLMYGFPTQTEQETVDALERVRQLFEAGCIQSAYWHRFSVTAHSPIGICPENFSIRVVPEPPISFARNDLAFEDPTGCDHDRLGVGLKKALYNFMQGVGLDWDVRIWLGTHRPQASRAPRGSQMKGLRPQVSSDFIQNAIAQVPSGLSA